KNSQLGGVNSDKIIDIKNPPFKLRYDPSNPFSNVKGYVKTSNVNPIYETINSITAARNYQANIEILNTVKSLIMKIISIGQQ
ncbi:flagellar basal body rod protein FlgC, partial [Buchnera aphidicola (Hormaphis cornu)]